MQTFQRWKNFKNWLRFDEIAVIDLGRPVFWATVYYTMRKLNESALKNNTDVSR